MAPDDGFIALAEQRLFVRPSSEEDAKDALEWMAAREGKTLEQLVSETRDSHGPVSAAS